MQKTNKQTNKQTMYVHVSYCDTRVLDICCSRKPDGKKVTGSVMIAKHLKSFTNCKYFVARSIMYTDPEKKHLHGVNGMVASWITLND